MSNYLQLPKGFSRPSLLFTVEDCEKEIININEALQKRKERNKDTDVLVKHEMYVLRRMRKLIAGSKKTQNTIVK